MEKRTHVGGVDKVSFVHARGHVQAQVLLQDPEVQQGIEAHLERGLLCERAGSSMRPLTGQANRQPVYLNGAPPSSPRRGERVANIFLAQHTQVTMLRIDSRSCTSKHRNTASKQCGRTISTVLRSGVPEVS